MMVTEKQESCFDLTGCDRMAQQKGQGDDMSVIVGILAALVLLEMFPFVFPLAYLAFRGFLWWEAVRDYRDACFTVDDDNVLRRFGRKQKLYGQTTLSRFREIARPGRGDSMPWRERDASAFPSEGEKLAGVLHCICRAVTNVLAWPVIALVDLAAVQGTKAVWHKLRSYADTCRERGPLLEARSRADGTCRRAAGR